MTGWSHSREEKTCFGCKLAVGVEEGGGGAVREQVKRWKYYHLSFLILIVMNISLVVRSHKNMGSAKGCTSVWNCPLSFL